MNAIDFDTLFFGCLHRAFEQIDDDFVANGRNADGFALFDEIADHLTASVGFTCAWGALNRQNVIIQGRADTASSFYGCFCWFLLCTVWRHGGRR